ncbi:MAG TPA: GNAT family N-acetyltransferase, partial [Bryobacteraceae bacterium]|nr:GNAT family N-acetyltransferase [Bryobacteraceae bacterium]
PNPYYWCLIAEQDGAPAGFALCFYSYSTWLGRPGVYLEDLFVLPAFRGLGIGKALLKRVAAIAVEKECPRLGWEVLDWNKPAIEFYEAMGAEFLDTWRNVRVSGETLKRLGADESLPPFRQEAGERMGHPTIDAEQGPKR